MGARGSAESGERGSMTVSGRAIARSPESERARYGWLSTARVAEMIGGDEPVSTAHVVRLIEARELRARNVASPGAKRAEWRIDPASVEEFLDRRTVEAVRA